MEEWRDVHNYEGLYQVSSEGRVKSLERVIKHGNGVGERTIKGKILSGTNNGNGYYSVQLCRDGSKKRKYLHILVAESFLSYESNYKIHVHHKNHIRHDNRLENLEVLSDKDHFEQEHSHKRVSKFRGVQWYKRNKKWSAKIRINNKVYHLGCFKDEVEASKEYQRALKEYLKHNRLTRYLKIGTEVINFKEE